VLQVIPGETKEYVVHLTRDCAGPVQLTDLYGQPAAGFQVTIVAANDSQLLTTDDKGRAWFAQRGCVGWVEVALPDGRVYRPRGRYEVRGSEPINIMLSSKGWTALVRLVNDSGEVLNGAVRGPFATFDEGNGVTATYSSVPVVWVTGTAAGYQSATVQVPADSIVHDVLMKRPRMVQVHAICEEAGCPTALRCDWAPCEGVGPDYLCPCNNGLAPNDLTVDDWHGALDQVPAGATEVEVDLRKGSAWFMGHWIGPLPCEGTISSAGSTHLGTAFPVICEPDGEFYSFGGMTAGVWNVTMNGADAVAHRTVTLRAGEHKQLGDVGPDRLVSISGTITADFPLTSSQLFSNGPIALDSTGHFSAKVGLVAGAVPLTLRDPDYGDFTNAVPATGPVDWSISWQHGRSGLVEPEAPGEAEFAGDEDQDDAADVDGTTAPGPP
jgi:hypothetical protein